MKTERLLNSRRSGFHFVFLSLVLGATLANSVRGGNFYAGTSPANVPWPGGVVPYEFTNTLTAAMKQTYLDGLREWELAANVKFVPHTNQTRWILFTYNTNYLDNVAPGYNPQVVTVSSLSRAQVGHEMGHSFGFTHENIRPDQTNYLTVVTNNIFNEPGNIFFFTVDPASVTNGNYDFESVMHLGWDFASLQQGVLATQQPKPAYSPRYRFRMGNYALSPGDRAALKFLYGPPAVLLTNIVTTTADSGPGSLRAAMYYVADHPGAVVQFNIPTSDSGYSNGVFNLHLSGQLPTIASDGMILDGSTQPGYAGKPLIVVDASQIIPETFTSDTLLIYSANNQIKNISLHGFNWNGVTITSADATNNTIAGCWIGLDSTGSNSAPNAFQGILIVNGASRNIIGGTHALARNVLSGNAQYGLWISDSNTTGNVVLGNYIGTDASGSFAVANASGGVALISNSVGQVIGGTNVLARNVISGNTSAGLWLSGAGVSNNAVQGNYIGLNAAGTAALPNSFAGIYVVSGARSNAILNNVISGNVAEGLRLSDPGTTANLVQGNFIGTDAGGTTAVPNGFLGLSLYSGAVSNIIGGTTAATRNIISGNFSEGLRIQGVGASGNLIQGNFIGTDVNGTTSIPNGWTGLTIFSGATANLIGGTGTGARNIISGNWSYGLVIANAGTSGNVVAGNFIGVGADGASAVVNGTGVLISDGAQTNTLGGTSAGARNVISGNYYSGVNITDPGTSWNSVQGNYIGTSTNGLAALANGYEAIDLVAGAHDNLIGGAAAGAGNVLSGNGTRGVWISDTNTTANLVQGNYIGLAADGTTALGNAYEGILIRNGAQNNVIGLKLDGSGAGNRIAFSGYEGIRVDDTSTFGNTLRGNSIYSNGALGIDLSGPAFGGVTANDPGDGDVGPNNLQNFPVITNAFTSGAGTLVSGTLNSAASRTFVIDVYRNTSADPSGYGEGQVFVGSTSASTSGSGNAVFSISASGNFSGQYFSATATDQTTGDTSEFSADVIATNGPVAPTFLAPITMTSTGFTAKISLTLGQNYRVQTTTNLGANPIAWTDLTNFTASATNYIFLDRSATNLPRRFYRVVSP